MKTSTIDWNYLSASSHYILAKEIKYCINEGETNEALTGLDELIDSMSKIALREVKSHLVVIMLHVLKWKYQPQKRSRGWRQSIYNSRDEIEDIQEETPSTTNQRIIEIWDKAFVFAIRKAVDEMEMTEKEIKKFNPEPLTWQEVFEDDYYLKEN
jgi:cobyrinic acid a,c-diamide synthase